jgi:uncharacterized protein (DUF433 family)
MRNMSSGEQQSLLNRITSRPGVFNGRPIIRDMRFPVADILEMPASGMSSSEILEQHPILQADDIRAALLFVSMSINNKVPLNAA